MRRQSVVAVGLALGLWACSAPMGPEDAGDGGGGSGGDAGRPDGGGTDAGVDAGVPERILFLFDGAPSLAVTDPLGSRAAALDAYLSRLPNEARVEVAVLVFAGSVVAVLSPSGLIEFTPLPDFTPAERVTLRERLLGFVPPGMPSGTRDFVHPVNTLYELLYRETQQALTLGQPQARYTLVFVSDGSPTNNQDDELLCGRAVVRIRELADSAVDVRLHTVHLFMPATPVPTTCTEDAGLSFGRACEVPSPTLPVCPGLQVESDAERLRRMAVLGAGRFLDFRSAPVDFSQVLP